MKVILEFETTDETGEVSCSENTALMEMTEQGLRLCYVEDVSGDGNKTRNTLLLSDTTLRVLRNGELQSDFLYEHGMQHNTVYQTPYGTFPVTLHTKRFTHNAEGVDYKNKKVTDNFFIELGLAYTLSIGADTPMKMEMNLKIRPV